MVLSLSSNGGCFYGSRAFFFWLPSLVRCQPRGKGLWVWQPSAAGGEQVARSPVQPETCAFLGMPRPIGSVFRLCAHVSVWPSRASRFARHSAKSGGGSALTSGKLSYRSS